MERSANGSVKALALAVGWSGLKLISISSEVSSGLETASTTTSTSGGATVIKTSMPPSTSSSFYNPYIFQNHQLQESEHTPPEFRIPYEYILYYKWHQQQLQQRQRSGNRERDAIPENDEIYRHYRPVYVDHNHRGINSPLPPPPPPVEHGERMSWPDEKQMITRPAPPLLPPPPPVPVPQSSDERQETPPVEDGGNDDEDKQSKIFRSILRHRKNFSSRDPNTTSEGGERKWNEELVRATSPGVVLRADEEDGEEQLSKDSTSRALALHRRGETRDRVVVPPPDYQSPGEALQLSSPVSGEGGGGENEMNRMMMMMMRANSPQEFETADARSPTKRLRSNPSSPPHRPSTNTKIFPDFEQRYAKVLLVSGLLALCTVVFQFLTSFLLLCFADKGSNAAAQIWTAVNCSVIFCLSTCLVLFLCEGLSMAKYVFEETLYLSLVTLDSLLSIYFLWVVMAFI